MRILQLHNKPRNAPYAEHAGAYVPVVRSDRPLAYPGEKIILQVFISGYGEINNPKIFIVVPHGLHDPEESYAYYDLKEQADKRMVHGAHHIKMPEVSTQSLMGIQRGDWKGPTYMVDTAETNDSTPPLISEYILGRAPIEIELKINKLRHWGKNKIRAGIHPVQFILTYHNGENWETSTTVHGITVPNWYQRNSLAMWIIATVIAAIAIIPNIKAWISFLIDAIRSAI